MKKRVLSLLLVALMIIGMIPSAALADVIELPPDVLTEPAYEAKIGTTNYETLEAAISAVTAGQTITLLKNIERSTMITSMGKSYTLDLNTYEIKATADITSVIAIVNGTVTITGNGKITGYSTSKGAVGVTSVGPFTSTLTIENGYFKGGVGATGNNAFVYLNGGYYNMSSTLLLKAADYPTYPKCFDYNKDYTTILQYPFTIVDTPVAEVECTAAGLGSAFGSLKAIMDMCAYAYGYSSGAYSQYNIRLISDVTEKITVPAGPTFTLDLNGKKLSSIATSTINTATITNNGNLTITDNSTNKNGIVSIYAAAPSIACNAISNNGALTIKNGTVKNEVTGTGNIYAIETTKTATAADLTISGGAFVGNIKINAAENVTASVTGGKFTGIPYVYGTAFKFVSGGIYSCNNADGYLLTTFVVDGKDVFANTDEATSTQYPYAIAEPTGYAAYVEKGGVKTYYTKLADVLAKGVATSGDIIVLCNDDLTADADEFLVVRNGITLDLNGHKVKASALSVFGNLIDTTAKNVKPSGLIQVDSDMFTYSAGSKDTAYQKLVYLPAYESAASGYRIYAISGFTFTATKASSTAYNVTFRPNLRAGSTYYSSILAETAGVQVFVQFDITRTVGSVQTPVPLIGELTQAYKDNFVTAVGTSGTALFSAALSLSEAAPSVKVTPYIASRGMTVCAQSKTPS